MAGVEAVVVGSGLKQHLSRLPSSAFGGPLLEQQKHWLAMSGLRVKVGEFGAFVAAWGERKGAWALYQSVRAPEEELYLFVEGSGSDLVARVAGYLEAEVATRSLQPIGERPLVMAHRRCCVIEESRVLEGHVADFVRSVETMFAEETPRIPNVTTDLLQDATDPRAFVVLYYFLTEDAVKDVRASDVWKTWRRELGCHLEGTPSVVVANHLANSHNLEISLVRHKETARAAAAASSDSGSTAAATPLASPPHHPAEFSLPHSEEIVQNIHRISSDLVPHADLIRARYDTYLSKFDRAPKEFVLSEYLPVRCTNDVVRFRERLGGPIQEVKIIGEWIDWNDDLGVVMTRWQDDACDDVNSLKSQSSHTNSLDWEAAVNGMPEGTLYKYKITYEDGSVKYCIPPTATYMRIHEDHVANAVLVTESVRAQVEARNAAVPLPAHPRVYQVHVGMCSEEEKVASYRDVITAVLPHMVTCGFDTLLLMGVQEHTYYPHAGWHVDSPIALSSRFGTKQDFAKLVSAAHRLGLRVCIQYITSHLASGCNSIAYVDGLTCGPHPEWDGEVVDYYYSRFASDFMTEGACYWLQEYDIDGFLFDGVSSVIFNDRAANRFFDRFKFDTYYNHNMNVDGGAFFVYLNKAVREVKLDAMTIAGDYVGTPGLAGPVSSGALGFTYTYTPHARAALSKLQRDFYAIWRFNLDALKNNLDRRTAEWRMSAVDTLSSNMVAKRSLQVAFFAWETLHTIAVGGIAPHVTELAAALRRVGHQVHVFTRATTNVSTVKVVHGVFYHEVTFQLDRDFVKECENMCGAFVSALLAHENAVGKQFDLCHAHDWLTARAIQAMAGLGRTTVFTMHSTEAGRCGNKMFGGVSQRIRDLERAGCHAASRVICVSGVLADEVKSMYQVHSEKIRVTYNGCNVQNFDGFIDAAPVKESLGLGPMDPTILFVGRLVLQKGVDLLVEAAQAIRSFRGDVKFVIVGDGHMRADVEERAKHLGVFDAFRFVGAKSGEELKSLFKMCDAVIVPSRNEPFGIVVLEAWSCYKPVIATTSGGPRDFVTPWTDGLLVDPNPGSIAWGVCEALKDFGKLRWMGEQGFQKAKNSFSWDRIGTQTRDIYYELLNLGDAGYSYEPDNCGSLAQQCVGEAIKFHMGVFDGDEQARVGLTLLRMLTVLNETLAAEAVLNFQGSEFGHPDYVDFPRPGNHFKQARRIMSLATRKDLMFKHHLAFTTLLARRLGAVEFRDAASFVSFANENVLIVEKGELVCVFNMNCDAEFDGLTISLANTQAARLWTLLTTDELVFGGWDRVPSAELAIEDGTFTLPRLPSKVGIVFTTKPDAVEPQAAIDDIDAFLGAFEAQCAQITQTLSTIFV